MLNWPGAIAPRRIERPTSTVDLHRWLLDLARGAGVGTGGAPLARAEHGIEGELHLAAAASVRGGI